MKNIIIGIVIGLTVALTAIYFYQQSQEEPTPDYIEIVDTETMGLAYGIANPIYKLILGEDIYPMISNEDTFILFIGRQTCPYCQKMAPQLNLLAQNYGFDTIYYVDVEDERNNPFMTAQEIDAVPFTAFIKNGVVTDYIPGYVDDSILIEIFEAFVDEA